MRNGAAESKDGLHESGGSAPASCELLREVKQDRCDRLASEDHRELPNHHAAACLKSPLSNDLYIVILLAAEFFSRNTMSPLHPKASPR